MAPLTDEIEGNGFTVTTAVEVDEQPVDVSVPVTTYVVVTVGEAMTEIPVVVFNPVEGDHEKVFAPVANNVTDDPAQIVAELTDTDGRGFTVTFIVASVAFCPGLGVKV